MRTHATCLALVFAALAASTSSSVAVSIPFEVSATLEELGTLGGTITINVTTGSVDSAAITAPGTPSGPFTSFQSQSSGNGSIVLSSSDAHFIPSFLTLFLPVISLIGYDGGPLCSLTLSLCPGPSSGTFNESNLLIFFPGLGYGLDPVLSGNLTPVSGPNLGSGLPGLMLAGGGLLVWWRARRKAAKSHSGALAA
jgi:hypothetical protein